MLELKRLKHFLAVVEHGQIRRAATALHMSQSALTRSLQRLEESLGAEVMVRSQAGVSLTPVGVRLKGHAQKVLREARLIESDIQNMIGEGDLTEVRLGMNGPFANNAVLHAVTEASTHSKTFEAYIREGFYFDLVAQLRMGELDLLFSVIPEGADSSGLVTEVLIDRPTTLSVYLRPEHPYFNSNRSFGSSLLQLDWIGAANCMYTPRTASYFLDHGMVPPSFRVKTDSPSLLEYMLINHDYAALLTDFVAEPFLKGGSLKQVAGSAMTVSSSAGLVYLQNSVQSSEILYLQERLRAACRRLNDTHDPIQ